MRERAEIGSGGGNWSTGNRVEFGHTERMDPLVLLAAAFDVGMKLATLLLEYLKVMVWPAVVVWALWMYRHQLRDFIDRVRSGKVGWFEFATNNVQHLSEESEVLPDLIAAQSTEEHRGELVAAPEAPEPATLLGRLLLAWGDLEAAAGDAVARREISPTFARNLAVLFAKLERDRLIGPDTAAVARSLQKIRNDVVHRATETTLSPEFVDGFAETARNLATILRAVPDLDGNETIGQEMVEARFGGAMAIIEAASGLIGKHVPARLAVGERPWVRVRTVKSQPHEQQERIQDLWRRLEDAGEMVVLDEEDANGFTIRLLM